MCNSLRNSLSFIVLFAVFFFTCAKKEGDLAYDKKKEIAVRKSQLPYSDYQNKINHINLLASQRNYEDAIRELNQIIVEYPSKGEPHWLLSKTMYWQIQNSSSPEDIHYFAINRYPDRMKRELELYLELEPNGEHASNAAVLLEELRNQLNATSGDGN